MSERVWPWAAGIAVVVAAAAVVILLISTGSMTGTMSAVIATSLTAALSAVGLSIQSQASRRTQSTAREENRRLQLEAAMRAAQLLAPTNGASADQASAGAALLALCDLGQLELAVALLGDTWRRSAEAGPDAPHLAAERDAAEDQSTPLSPSGISNATAVLVIDKALASAAPSSRAQVMAAEVLCRNSRSLCSISVVDWPSCIDGTWRPDLPDLAKLYIMDALMRMTVADSPGRLALAAVAMRLYGIYDAEGSVTTRPGEANRFQWCASRMLHAVMPALKDCGWEQVMGRRRDPVSMAALEAAARYGEHSWPRADPLRDLERERYDWLKDWSNRSTPAADPRRTLASGG
jgi:hypothetical protein